MPQKNSRKDLMGKEKKGMAAVQTCVKFKATWEPF